MDALTMVSLASSDARARGAAIEAAGEHRDRGEWNPIQDYNIGTAEGSQGRWVHRDRDLFCWLPRTFGARRRTSNENYQRMRHEVLQPLANKGKG